MNHDQYSILIIDDNESICKSLSMVLKHKGYIVSSAGTGQEAIELNRNQVFDLALLDMRLPDSDGTSILKELINVRPDIQVIMITGFASVESAVQTMGDGAAGYITKPLDMDQLLEKIRNILDKQELIRHKHLAEEKLTYERNMFDTFLKYIPDTVYFKDCETKFVRVSKSLSDLFNTNPAAMIGKTDKDFFSEALAALKSRNDISVIHTGKPIINKEEQDSKDRWVTTTKLPWYDASGNIIGIFGMSRDITDQKHAAMKLKQAMQELEARNRERNTLFESAKSILTYQSFDLSARKLFDTCSQLIGSTSGYIALLTEDGAENEVLFLESGGLSCTVDPDLPMPIRGLRAEAYKTGKVVYDNDFMHSKWVQYMPEGHVILENVLFAPLNIDNKTVGIMGLANKVGGFNEHDAQIASTYGDLAAISLSRCRILDTLRESEERFRVIASSAQDALIMMDHQGNISFWNEAAERTFGYSSDEVIGQNLHSLLIPERYHEQHKKGFDEFLKTGNGAAIGSVNEMTAIRKNGEEFPLELSLSAVKIGTDWHSIGIIRDISERKQAEDKLKQSEQLYRNVIDNIGIGVALISPEMNILTMNKQMKEWFPNAYNAHNPLCYKVFPKNEKDKTCLCCPAEKTFNDGNIHTEDLTHDGQRHYRVVTSPIFDMNGNIATVIEMVDDITDELMKNQANQEYAERLETTVAERTKDLEESLRKTRKATEQIKAILKSAAEGIIVTDHQNNVILMNKSSEQMLQVSLQDVLNKPIELAINDERLNKCLRDSFNNKSDNSCTLEIMNDHEHRYLKANISHIRGNSGGFDGKIISFHDITREHEIDRMKTEFISTAAHELRTPLTSILGFSEILCTRQDIDLQDQQKYLGYINKQSVRLAKIINEILDISRIESGKGIDLNKGKCSIHELIAQVTDIFREQSVGHVFNLNLPDKQVMLNADAEKIEQVLKNVLSNAVKYSPGGGEINISGVVDENHYRIDIKDHGIGMTPDQIERIYDKFYRADASNTAIEGTGLGMSIVKMIIEAHGGTVNVTSKSGVGTCVSLILPL